MGNKIRNINLPAINMLLYSGLLVATPFIMLQNYLQGWVKSLSSFNVHFGQLQFPFVVLVAIAFAVIAAIMFREKITVKNLKWALFSFLWLAFGQWVSDFYINYSFYDLQNNWHYLAYFVFAFIVFRALGKRNWQPNKVNYAIYIIAAFVSLFDEIFQNMLSERIFDLSDVAKDLWGVSLGIVIINVFVFANESMGQKTGKGSKTSRHKSVWFISSFSFCFLFASSLLTDAGYADFVLFLTILLFIPVFFVLRYWKGKTKKWIKAILAILIAGQLSVFALFHGHNFILHNNFLTIYKGIPLVFFDVAVFPDHTFRYADKKTEFNKTDKETLLKYKPDILLIGAGKNMDGGNGFPFKDKSHFIYNQYTNSAVQVIILDSKSACRKYNELSKKGLKTLFVLHKDL